MTNDKDDDYAGYPRICRDTCQSHRPGRVWGHKPQTPPPHKCLSLWDISLGVAIGVVIGVGIVALLISLAR